MSGDALTDVKFQNTSALFDSNVVNLLHILHATRIWNSTYLFTNVKKFTVTGRLSIEKSSTITMAISVITLREGPIPA